MRNAVTPLQAAPRAALNRRSVAPVIPVLVLLSVSRLAKLPLQVAKRHSLRCIGCYPSDGAGGGTRTHNLLITNQGLCQLSYAGFGGVRRHFTGGIHVWGGG